MKLFYVDKSDNKLHVNSYQQYPHRTLLILQRICVINGVYENSNTNRI